MHLLQLTILLSLACIGLARPQGAVNVVGPDVVPAPGQAKIGSGTDKNSTGEKKQEASVTSRPNDKANDKFGGVTISHADEAPSTAQPAPGEEVQEQDILFLPNIIEGSSANEGQKEPRLHDIILQVHPFKANNDEVDETYMDENDIFNQGNQVFSPRFLNHIRTYPRIGESSIDSDESHRLDDDLRRYYSSHFH